VRSINSVRFADPRFLLMYSALQFGPEEQAKPDGSLSLPYVAGALRRAGFPVEIYDVSVGNKDDRLEDTFFNTTLLPSGLIRCGASSERIAQVIQDFDVIGISSIFTTQTTMVLDLVKLVRRVDPTKLIIAGGVNARNLRSRFFAAGVDVILLSEAENTIVQIADAVRGRRTLSEVPGIAFLNDRGEEVINRIDRVVTDLDELPLPAWDLLPNDKYWQISRPHGGEFAPGQRIQYAALQTSRGCPFKCKYCHISQEDDDHVAGPLGTLRLKSIDRVLLELQTLKDLGVHYVYFEDDSLFAKKKRAYTLFKAVAEMGLDLSDVNGINICHLQRNAGNGTLEIDMEFLEAVAAAGFHMLHLPFESASPRLLAKYSTSKWNPERTDIEKMIRSCLDVGIKTAGNYMIGYPDETLEEIFSTIMMAKRHVSQGMNHAQMFAVVPFPGTMLYDQCVASGQLNADFNPDHMKWTKSILTGLAVSPDTLEHIRQLAWLTVNRTDFVDYKIKMRVAKPGSAEELAPVHSMKLAVL
jgi:anaerobic magnesium-protoporphyrin IX monomethyl ester cyclase